MPDRWDPDRYLAYADERGRPFLDLLARVPAGQPERVVDLGCGPGNLTRLLEQRWPQARIHGVDSSPDMVAAARRDAGASRVHVELGDVRTWRPDHPVDVLLSNATLQWVPGHLDLLERLVGHVAPGGWLAFQVPGNFDEPSHTIRRRLAARADYAPWTADVAAPEAFGPDVYLERLAGLGCTVDAWETTYLHVLTGTDPVFTWVSGTGARPTLQALPEEVRPAFEEELRSGLREVYPERAYGVVLPFRRVFVVARVHQ